MISIPNPQGWNKDCSVHNKTTKLYNDWCHHWRQRRRQILHHTITTILCIVHWKKSFMFCTRYSYLVSYVFYALFAWLQQLSSSLFLKGKPQLLHTRCKVNCCRRCEVFCGRFSYSYYSTIATLRVSRHAFDQYWFLKFWISVSMLLETLY